MDILRLSAQAKRDQGSNTISFEDYLSNDKFSEIQNLIDDEKIVIKNKDSEIDELGNLLEVLKTSNENKLDIENNGMCISDMETLIKMEPSFEGYYDPASFTILPSKVNQDLAIDLYSKLIDKTKNAIINNFGYIF